MRSDIERVADVDLIPGDIPEICNRLSHGAEDYSWQTLRPAMRTMSAIGAAHVLHLLDLLLNRLSTVTASTSAEVASASRANDQGGMPRNRCQISNSSTNDDGIDLRDTSHCLPNFHVRLRAGSGLMKEPCRRYMGSWACLLAAPGLPGLEKARRSAAPERSTASRASWVIPRRWKKPWTWPV